MEHENKIEEIMKWRNLARHIRKCPQCSVGNLQRKRKNLWSKEIKYIGKKTVGMECSEEGCNFFITMLKLNQIAPKKKQINQN
jgi:hypothetical protein